MAKASSSPAMPWKVNLAKRGARSGDEFFFRRSKSSASTVTLSILTVVSLSPVAGVAGITATTLFSTKPEGPCAAALP